MTPRELANEHSRKHNARTTGEDSDAPKKIRELQERIKRMEEAGDALYEGWIGYGFTKDKHLDAWHKAKESK